MYLRLRGGHLTIALSHRQTTGRNEAVRIISLLVMLMLVERR